MSVENEEVESLDTSATTETLDETTPPDTGAVDAESSTAEDDGAESGLLDVVRDAVQKTRTPESPAGEADSDDGAGEDPPAGDVTQDDEDFSDVPFHKHPRFQELVRQRNDLRSDADRMRNIQKFADENDLSGEDMAKAIHLSALMKRDPQAAWTELKPLVQDLALRAGVVLPPDLRQQVQAGQLTAEAAKMVAQERARAEALQGKMSFEQQAAQRRQQAEEQQRQQSVAQARVEAASSWRQAILDRDPDFSRLEKHLEKEVLWRIRKDGQPATPEAVRKQLEDAYKAVKSEFAPKVAPRPGITPVTGGRTGGNPRKEPESLLDVIRANRASAG